MVAITLSLGIGNFQQHDIGSMVHVFKARNSERSWHDWAGAESVPAQVIGPARAGT